ncbi:hypothetical protein O5O45_24820 [Hahella aquimaris]|uniref:hypothetical protein n=1 Tax=Hahella sp. HNIBRBA332 TaxID=3015983 RepID=UPI00273C3FC0|nr:hypothetical protein [Hahella sp. HNIBRBA332]WLQ12955.1 hypothetical protein O5O45_24820 [Hahella sp. HNIBRBA332]
MKNKLSAKDLCFSIPRNLLLAGAVALSGCNMSSIKPSTDSGSKTEDKQYATSSTPETTNATTSQETATSTTPGMTDATSEAGSATMESADSADSSNTGKTTQKTTSTAKQKTTTPAAKKTVKEKTATKKTASSSNGASAKKKEAEKPQTKTATKESVKKETAKKETADTSAETKPVVETAMLSQPKETSGLQITGSMLPYDFGGWMLEKDWDSAHIGVCRLRSERHPIFDGYENSSVWIEVLAKEVNVYTRSNVDLTYPGVGLQLAEQTVLDFSEVFKETNARIKGDHTRALQNANKLTVKLGFWPSWPQTQTQQAVIPATVLKQAIPVFLNCKNL